MAKQLKETQSNWQTMWKKHFMKRARGFQEKKCVC
jgi:hypothetical protein